MLFSFNLIICISVISLFAIILLLLSVAFTTLLERKFIAIVQKRIGPSYSGILGIIQPIADAIKLILKQLVYPKLSDRFCFILAPISIFLFSFQSWALIPFSYFNSFSITELSLLWLFILSTLSVYSLFISGWSSHCIYSLLGSVRSILQMISYDISLSFLIFPILFVSGSVQLLTILSYQSTLCFSTYSYVLCASWCFLLTILAETNRAPFDLPEAESELVAGYNSEYSSIPFAYFFLGEYLSLTLMSLLFTILFLGGNLSVNLSFLHFLLFMLSKVMLVLLFIILTRATLGRMRFDYLLLICWKYILIFSVGLLIYVVAIYCWGNAVGTLVPVSYNYFVSFIDIVWLCSALILNFFWFLNSVFFDINWVPGLTVVFALSLGTFLLIKFLKWLYSNHKKCLIFHVLLISFYLSELTSFNLYCLLLWTVFNLWNMLKKLQIKFGNWERVFRVLASYAISDYFYILSIISFTSRFIYQVFAIFWSQKYESLLLIVYSLIAFIYPEIQIALILSSNVNAVLYYLNSSKLLTGLYTLYKLNLYSTVLYFTGRFFIVFWALLILFFILYFFFIITVVTYLPVVKLFIFFLLLNYLIHVFWYYLRDMIYRSSR